jgi:hypothetical protein
VATATSSISPGCQPTSANNCRTPGINVCALRLISLLRESGYDAPIYLHGAMLKLCALYEERGIPLGALRPSLESGNCISSRAPSSAASEPLVSTVSRANTRIHINSGVEMA